MIESIENRINEILKKNININSKHNAVKSIIDAIPSTRMKRAVLHAFKNYKWPKKENQPFPTFRLTNIEKAKSLENCYFPGWAEDVFDHKTFARSSELVNNADNMLRERNLPNGLYSILSDVFESECNKEGEYSKNDAFHFRDFSYSISHKPGEQILMTLIEKRTDRNNHKKDTYVDHYDIKYQKGNVITERTLALDESKPEDIWSRTLYIDSKRILEEYCNDSDNEGTYSQEDKEFIYSLGSADQNSEVFKNAIKNGLSYAHCSLGSNGRYFMFGKRKGVLGYSYSFFDNDKRLLIYSNDDDKQVKVVVYSTLPGNDEELSFTDFINSAQDSSVVNSINELLAKLESLGVNIVYSKFNDNKLGKN